MAPGQRQLFIYYRVRFAQTGAVIDLAQRMQRSLLERCPGLQAALMRRPDTHNNTEVTLMETYALDAAVAPNGIDDALRDRIEAAALAALGAYLCGPRHVEVFDACA